MLQDDNPYPLLFHRVDGTGFRTIDSGLDLGKVGLEDDRLVNQEKPACEFYHSGQEILKMNRMNMSPFDKMSTLTLIAAAAAANEAGRSSTSTTSLQPNVVSFTPSLSSFDRVDQMRKPNMTYAASDREDSSMGVSSESEDGNDFTAYVKESHQRNAMSTSMNRDQDSAGIVVQKQFGKSTVEESLQECPSSCSSGQDKRFTGLSPHEVRCGATTTRGRPCTYAAVQSTKYCYLHADYDTNPPPRRVKASNGEEKEVSTSSPVTPVAMINNEDNVSDDEDPSSASLALSTESKANMDSKMSAPSVASFKKRRTNAKLAEKHAESPRPLLSMIATDQWFGQSVQIAVGPLKGKTGTVQKWGNGWITVLIQGVGCHNRRSFELYLDTGDIDREDVGAAKLGKKKASTLKNLKEQDRRLFRCVSRDVVSPSPPTTNLGSAKKSRAVTPKPTSLLNPRVKKEASTPKNPRVDPSDLIEILETPLPQCISDGAETPIRSKSSLDGISSIKTALSLPTAKVTPFSEKNTTGTRTLTAQDRCNVDLRFPGHSDDEARDETTGINSSDSALVFRPSMGERTRGRASIIGGNHHRSQSSDSTD
jgi:hypothetical protein